MRKLLGFLFLLPILYSITFVTVEFVFVLAIILLALGLAFLGLCLVIDV